LQAFGVEAETAKTINGLLRSLSRQRRGALLLVVPADGVPPDVVGHIDTSSVGDQIRGSVVGTTLEQLAANRSAAGLLSTDGMTTIDTAGTVLQAGVIVSLANAGISDGGGGGRTQAARAASRNGLVLKVSEDGPISLFRDGHEIVKLQY
jgi:DNA integrity scanning protein DisA with diadenylate cyclase activity